MAPNNVNTPKLLDCMKETADFATNHQLPMFDYCVNHRGEEDVAIFDFTAIHQAKYSCYGKERRGHKLFLSIVGDTLIEVCESVHVLIVYNDGYQNCVLYFVQYVQVI